VAKFLSAHFTRYVDYDFTAKLEDELDEVSRGEAEWVPLLEKFWKPFSKTVEEKAESVERSEASGSRVLGVDPVSGKPVSVRLGRYGPFAQIGTAEDEDKPKFASLRGGQSMHTITLEEAIKLFDLPRTLGESKGENVTVAVGRFGPFAKRGGTYASLGKEDDPYTISFERAVELIDAKELAVANRIIKKWDDAGIEVLNGRYGPYVTDGSKNANVPKDTDPKSLDREACVALLAEKGKPARKGPAARKAAAKKAPARRPAKAATGADGDAVAKISPARKAASNKAAPKKAAAKKAAVSKAAEKKTVARKKPAKTANATKPGAPRARA